MQKNRSVPDVQRKRSQWIETISGANAEHQIYLDESGINTNFTRHYAHAVHGKRAMDIGIANAGDGKLIPVDGFKGVHAQLDAREEFRHGFLDGNFLFYRFPGFLRILVILSGSERKSYVSAGKVWICRYRPGTYSAVPLTQVKKRKTAAYARVSTDHEDQASSYEAQVDYYTNYIKSRDDWKFAGIYADEGISGCNTKSVTALTAWCRTRWTDASI